METLQQRLMRKVPGLRTPQPVGGIRMPASGFRAPSIPQAIPGVGATKTVLNSPATKGLVKAGGKRMPVVGGLINAGLATYDVSQGADPLRAYGRAATEMAGGALGAGAAGLLAIPSGPGAAVAAGAGYMGGSTAAGTAFDALFPQTVNPVVPEKKPSSSSSEKAKKVPAGAFGDIVNKFDRSMAPSNVPAGAFGDIVNKFDNAMNPSSAPEIKFELPTFAATGTDTGSGDREVGRSDPRNAEYINQRSALTADSTDAERKVVQDAGMAAWAKANAKLPEAALARGSKQSGYDVIQNAVGLENNAISNYDADQTFTGKDIKEEYRQNLGDSGIKGITDAQTGAGADKKAQDFLKNYKAQLSGNLESFAETVIPSQSQNPVTFGGDRTPIDSELQVGKAIVDFKGDLNKNISNRFRAF